MRVGVGVEVLWQYLMEDATVGFLGIKIGIHQNNTLSTVSNQIYLLSSLSHGELPIFWYTFSEKSIVEDRKARKVLPLPQIQPSK